MSEQPVVIIGGGQAGGMVATTLRQLGYVGGITLVGDESWPPYERPPLSKTLLQGTLEVEKTFLRPIASYAEQDIVLLAGYRVQAIDRIQRLLHLDQGEPLPYGQLVIATGARARRLTLPGCDNAAVHALRNIDDALALRAVLAPAKRLLVVGGGFIGLEIAASARIMGMMVTVIEQAPQLMGRVLPSELASHIGGVHTAHGVDIRTNTTILSIEAHPQGGVVAQTSDGPVQADVVVAGIGSIPNTELAEAAGLYVDDGIVVDQFGQTSDACIWAAGDVTRHFNPLLGHHVRLESWKNAQNQAIAVARAIAGQPMPYAELPWLWSDQYDLNLQLTGIPRGGEQLVWRGTPEDGRFTVLGLTEGIPTFAITLNQGREMRFAQKLITRGTAIDPWQLTDTSIPLQHLCA